MSSFNAFGARKLSVGGNTPIWLGTVAPVVAGGVLAESFRKAGLFVGAGAPVNLTDGVITPIVVWEVLSVAGGVATCRPSIPGMAPTTSDKLYNAKAAFNASASGTSVTAVTWADNGETVNIAVAISGLAAGDALVLIGQAANGYLYNDICISGLNASETIEDVNATGAVVKHHAEGILIKRTPSAYVAAAMKAAVPNVEQVAL